MPPASLSTIAVMKPGPMTVKKIATWRRIRFSMILATHTRLAAIPAAARK
jgi:hypothetical protein